jgi:hypothetical protein
MHPNTQQNAPMLLIKNSTITINLPQGHTNRELIRKLSVEFIGIEKRHQNTAH